MDYGFVPGRDRHLSNVATVFRRRGTLIQGSRMVTLQAFVEHLDSTAAIPKPVDDLLLGGHANGQGVIFVKMFPGQVDWRDRPTDATTYEVLDETLTEAANSVEIPDDVIGFNAGDPVTHSLHFKGCNVGKVRADTTRIAESRFPFLAKTRDALGGNVHVTAPKHFHGVTPDPVGYFEFMAYEFVVRMPARLVRGRFRGVEDRDTLIDEFVSAAHEFVDGTTVPNDAWDDWLPPNVNRERRQQVRTPLGVSFGRRSTVNAPHQFRIDTIPYVFTITYPTAADVPAAPERLGTIHDAIRGVDEFDDAHPFPMFERFGYTSFQDFLDGYHWTAVKAGRRLVGTGRRYVYTLVRPIHDDADNLVFNFYPPAGSPHAAVTTALVETDDKYFGAV